MRTYITCFVVAFLCLANTRGQSFVVKDVLVSSADAQIGDFEFDAYRYRICWQSGDDNKLWVCTLDTLTWALTVPDGRQTLVDTSLTPISATSNGGEWGYDVSGTFLTYNKQINKTRYIGIAAEYLSTWMTSTLTDCPDRMNPHATQDPTDSAAAIQYIRSPNSDHTKYKFLDHLNWEHQVLWFTDAHWAKNNRVLTGIMCNGQVGMVDFSTCFFPEPITDEPGTVFSCPFMWRAPEKGNQRMFFARANENEIRVYKETGPISGTFALYMSFMSPSSNPEFDKIASPEPVIYQGQSYITFMTSSSPYETAYMPSEIWIARLDSLNPLFRMVSDTAEGIRTDPESLATPDSLFVYYTEVLQPHSPEAVYRLRKCDTGIGLEIPTGTPLTQNQEEPRYVAYPNPFGNRLSLTSSDGIESYAIAGPEGQIIWTGSDIGDANLSGLSKGWYYLRIISATGIQTVKIIKD